MTVAYLSGHGGVRVALDDTGPPHAEAAAVLLHGGAQTRHSWGATAEALAAAGYRALAVDLRGHGDSDWSPDGDYSPEALITDLDRVVDHAGVPVVLVGASLGGLVSTLYSSLRPERVRALTLVDVVPRNNPVGVERIRRFMSASPDGFDSFDEAVEAVAAYRPNRPRPADPAGLWRNLRATASGRLVWHWDQRFLLHDGRPWTYGREELLTRAAGRLRLPVLLLVGGASDVVDAEAVRGFRALVPHARVRTVPGATHMIAGDANDAFTDALLAFLAELRG